MQKIVADKIVFPNLNGLRFIAAFTVIIHHIEELKKYTGIDNIYRYNTFIDISGGLGVTLFFVLSGFLITYLLLAEKESSGTISIKKFYTRRILRIWPLYYLIVAIAFFVAPHFHFLDIPGLSEYLNDNITTKYVLFGLILPNVAYVCLPFVPFASQAWSIGVEEQFYLVWPWLIKYFKNYLEMLLFIIVLFVLFRLGLVSDIVYQLNKIFHFCSSPSSLNYFASRVNLFFYQFRIGSMAIGGIGAYLLFYNKQEILSLIYKRSFQVFIYCSLIYMLFRGINESHEFYSLFFIVIILNLAANKDSLLSLENRVFNYLGKVSYGIYMYHILAIMLAIWSVRFYDKEVHGFISNLLLYTTAIVYTLIMASVSFYAFEKQFINLKKLFAVVKSIDE